MRVVDETGNSSVGHEVGGAVFLRPLALTHDGLDLTPRLWASTSDLAMDAEVKLYAWTRTVRFAPSKGLDDPLRAAAVGEQWTAMLSSDTLADAPCPWFWSPLSGIIKRASDNDLPHFSGPLSMRVKTT